MFNLRIALGQMEVIPGRPDLNTAAVLKMIDGARQRQAQMVIFPEMAVPGYLLGDTWEQESFLRDCEECGRTIIEASKGLCVLYGNVGLDWNRLGKDGRVRKYNAFFIAQDGRLCGGDNFCYPFRIKTLQPNYREFDDNRYFFSLPELAQEMRVKIEDLLQPVNLVIDGTPLKLGCILCEDGWSDDYYVKPMAVMGKNGPVDMFVNISSSPFTLGKNHKRNRVFSRQVKEAGAPLIYVNNTGIQNNGKTIYTFDGSSTVYNVRGEIVHYCRPFAEQLKIIDFSPAFSGGKPVRDFHNDNDIGSVYQALVYGTGRFLTAIGMEKVVIGISGGIDSAVGACLYAKVLGPGNVLLVNMPSIYNSRTTKDLAARVAENLGCLYTVIPIQEAVDRTVGEINGAIVRNTGSGESFSLQVTPPVLENIQARDRSSRVLAGLAAAFGGGFTCNANKSEMTVGYGTLYGDLAGFLAALADLWKYQIYDLARYLNSHVYGFEVIPQDLINLVPSAELSFDQSVDQGKGDPIIYPYHDYLFKAFMEKWHRAAPEDILEWYMQGKLEENIGCAPGLAGRIFPEPADFIADLERWWTLYTGFAVAKRIQAPPVLAVSRRAYGFDHREAQNGPYFTGRYLRLKKQLLNC